MHTIKQKRMGLFKNYGQQKQIFNWAKRGINKLPEKAAGLYKKTVLDPQMNMNKELAQFQYDKNLEMWNLQNAYNDPSAQRQRMEDAGFNPNYMAGGGASSTGSAAPASMPQYNVQAPTYDPMSFYQKIIGAANGLMGLRQGMANLRKTQGQTGKLDIEENYLRATRNQRKMGIILSNEKSKTDNKLGDQLLQFRGGGNDQDLINPSGYFHKQRTAIDEQIESTKANRIFQQHKNELMRKYGITTSDNFMFRMGIKALDTIGVDPSSWLKSGGEGLSNYMRSK